MGGTGTGAPVDVVADGVMSARIVKQVTASPSAGVHTVVSTGDDITLESAGNSVPDFSVPAHWADGMKLHGVLSDGRPVFSALVGETRLLHVVHNGGAELLATLDEPGQVLARGNGIHRFGPSGVMRITPDSGGRHTLLAEPVTALAVAENGTALAVLTQRDAQVRLIREGSPDRTVLTATPALRPADISLCADGCHLMVLARTVEGRQAHLFDAVTGAPLRVVEGLGRVAALLSDCSLIAVDESWPHANVLTAPSEGDTVTTHRIDASVLGLHEDADGPLIHCTRPGRAPCVRPLRDLVSEAGTTPAPRHGTLPTRWGRLRVLTVPATDPVGDVVMLHGGPYGVWIPRWDPQVRLLTARGYQVHQVEAPYTASLRRTHTRFAPGDFGAKDVDSVTDAVTALVERHRRPMLMFGYSYGGLLAARTAARLPRHVRGLFLMSAIWRSHDLQRLIDDGRPAPGDLRPFLAHAFPDGHVALPEVELPGSLAVAVVHGTADRIAPFPLVEAACAASPRFALTRLVAEDHVPRRGSSVVAALHAMETWLNHCEGTP